jgi:hypothetical protein
VAFAVAGWQSRKHLLELALRFDRHLGQEPTSLRRGCATVLTSFRQVFATRQFGNVRTIARMDNCSLWRFHRPLIRQHTINFLE